MIKIKVQSISDLITNSSSEVFKVKSDLDIDTIKGIIETGEKNYGALDHCSGMGGDISIENWEYMYQEWLKWEVPENKRQYYTPEIWSLHYNESLDDLKSSVWIDIDWDREGTIKFILDTFWVTDCDHDWEYMQIDPETKKVIRLVSKEMYDKLPENCKFTYD